MQVTYVYGLAVMCSIFLYSNLGEKNTSMLSHELHVKEAQEDGMFFQCKED